MREKMYEAQAQAFDVITEAVRSGRPAIFFVDGPGGSGKSFLFEAIIRYVLGLRKLPLACAWSGIAASLLPNGRTVSSRFGLPVPLPEENARSYLKAQELKSRLLKVTDIILWDEISMSPLQALDAADNVLRDLCDDDRPFGGKVLVMGGDFRQVLPVVPRADDAKIKAHVVTRHRYFAEGFVERHSLAKNMRAALASTTAPSTNTRDYSEFLLEIGDGRYPVSDEVGAAAVRLPDEIVFPSSSDYRDYSKYYKDIVEWVLSDVVRYGLDLANTVPRMPESEPRIPSEELLPLSSRAVLAPKNVVVNDFNEEVLLMFDSTTVIDYVSTDKIQGATDEDYAQLPIEFLNSLELSGLPPHNLRLRP